MADHGSTLNLHRVQAMAYQVKVRGRKSGVTNFLVQLRAIDENGREIIGLGESQPRDDATGDRGDTSWHFLSACVSRLHKRELRVSDRSEALATVQALMSEFDSISKDYRADAARLVPFRGTLVGLETALLDLLARALEMPLVTILGSRRTTVAAHTHAVSARTSREQLRELLRDGSTFPATLLEGTDDVEENVALLESAAETNASEYVGAPDKPLWIDLNGRLNRHQASDFVKQVVHSIAAGRLPREIIIEQPVSNRDYDLLPTLQRRADRAAASRRRSGADVRIMANVGLWIRASLGRRAKLGLRLRRFSSLRRPVSRAVFVRPAQVGGILATLELVEIIQRAHPGTAVYLGGMRGGTEVTAGLLRNLAMAVPEIDSVADETLANEPVVKEPSVPGIGANAPYEVVLEGAKEFLSIPEMPAPTLDGRKANVYPSVTYLQPLGSNGTKGHLLEREALALGLSTVRYSKGAFVATDGIHEPLSFKWSRSPLSSAVSLALCTHKEATRRRLQREGAPVPRGNTFAMGAYDEAKAFVERIGYPVVVKPAMGVRGIGVVANIRDDEALQAAFDQLETSKLGRGEFIVEQHIEGKDYRIVVIGDEVIGAILREPGSVTGDGERTVAELVIAKNVARRDNPHLWGRPVKYDEAAKYQMRRAGITLDYVPEPGEKVVLSGSCSLSQGGESIDVLDELHPTIKDAAVRAVKAVPGLAFCGVDFLIEDHTKPLDGQQAGICELNAHAAIGNCEYPLYGTPRDVARILMQQCVEQFGLNTTERATTLALHLTVRGRVTGVGYRAWMQRRARSYGLTGWVRNVDNRIVEAVVVGDMEPATALVAGAVLGPRAAVPTDVTTTHLVDLPEFGDFEIVDRPPKEFRVVR